MFVFRASRTCYAPRCSCRPTSRRICEEASISVGATHDPLPDEGPPAAITGGVWSLRLLNGRRFTGLVTGGSLLNEGNDLFAVDVQMQILSGGSGQLRFVGTLSHQVFPPTLIGGISQ